MEPIPEEARPLADRIRPRSLDEIVGQAHLLETDRPLRRLLEQGKLHSMILWGPPGTGKTTLARLVAGRCDADFVQLSAVMAGVKDVRAAVAAARQQLSVYGRRTVLFLDEVHRFNKGQQDAFLPYVEDGTVVFVGATTENPSFELNNALLSRARTYVLKPLDAAAVTRLLERALEDPERGLATPEGSVEAEPGLLAKIAEAADGDARRALNLLEVAVELGGRDQAGRARVDSGAVDEALASGYRRFDKGGEAFYDQISALHKSVRGSDPDAALYWFCRMLDGGCDPRYLARRLIRMASEDIGNADPRALALSLDAAEVYERLGSPEGELALAQALIYLAVAAKSNAVYTAFGAAKSDVQATGSLEVPLRLRNAPTGLMKELGYGQGYRYAHDEPDALAAGERYFPDEMEDRRYYHPVPRGLEQRIADRLEEIREAAQAGAGSERGGRG